MSTPLSFRQTILLATAIAILGVSHFAKADDDAPRILVTGVGTVDVAPDMAVLQLTVTREAETARAALDANSSAISEVLDSMQKEGIEKRDLQTSNFSIQPKYVYPKPRASGERQQPQIVGYTVRNSLMVRVRDIERVGAILDKSVTLGVNEGGNITFTNADPSPAIAQARTLAVQDAFSKGKTLADAAGVKTGKILEISEQTSNPRPMPMARSEMVMGKSADVVPIATGENSYKVSVNVSFAIEQ